MNSFEQNSIHLNAAGYSFGTVSFRAGAETPRKLNPGSNWGHVIMFVWIKDSDATADPLRVIAGSEPKIGVNEEIAIPQSEIEQVIMVDPKTLKPVEKKNEGTEEE